ncbi:MAG: fibrobacter succinogenes major paralogous domain-containing protein [Paludibacter sp.]
MKEKSKLSVLYFVILLYFLIVANSCNPTISAKFLPILTTNDITQITQNTAICGGNISSDSGFEVTARGVCWSLKPNPTIDDNLTKSAAGSGLFSCSINNLLADTTYYVRAYATNKDGTAYGLQVTFKTLPAVLPVLTTTAITNITGSTAVSGGNITFDGGTPIIARGVCWSITENPTIMNDKTSDGNGGGIFTSTPDNLQSGTIYYLRAYATNSAGTSYGSQVTFKTLSIPIVTTSSITSITTTTANSGGNITSDGGSTVTARGICWSTSINPIISNYITTDGNGLGIFTSKLTNLKEGINYYVRAYATNIVGTAYGDNVGFKANTSTTLTDIDGNIYKVVTIGTQTWMAENLKVTHYCDGSTIPNMPIAETNIPIWSSLLTGAYCDNNNTWANIPIYGRLYNWYAATDSRNIAPVGWHVPSDGEWTTLESYVSSNLGTSTSVAKALAATTNWYSSTNIGTIGNDLTKNNFTGFSALPGGDCSINFTFFGIGSYGYWWSSTEVSSTNASNMNMGYNSSSMSRRSSLKQAGFSIRCIKD